MYYDGVCRLVSVEQLRKSGASLEHIQNHQLNNLFSGFLHIVPNAGLDTGSVQNAVRSLDIFSGVLLEKNVAWLGRYINDVFDVPSIDIGVFTMSLAFSTCLSVLPEFL